MLSIGAVASPAAAGAYFNRDDYYASADSPPSAWMGEGAERLGLEGAVEKDAFQSVLEGHVPGEDRRLGFEQDGDWKHRAGWDLTFSAPKSVSVMAQVGGDARLIAAHDKAVAAALAVAEKEVAATQAKRDGAIVSEPTGNLVAATFRHDLSRNQDPQLHTHVVVANMTHTDRGWRSLDSKPLYDNAKMLGVAYQQTLALEARKLGYEVEARANGTFEIKGVDEKVLKTFSTRSAEIGAKLDQMGGRAHASPADRAKATLATRRKKGVIGRDEARDIWRGAITAEQATALETLKGAALERARDGAAARVDSGRASAADAVLKETVASLSERDAAFSRDRTLEMANRIGVGRADRGDLAAALYRAVADKTVIGKQVVEADRLERKDVAKEGLTTKRQQAIETDMLRREAAWRGGVGRLATPRAAAKVVAAAEAKSAAHGHRWTEDQRSAATHLLTSTNRVHAVQGLAGTAKTTTVLATYAAEAARIGKDVRALAPTASAARTLGEALNKPAATVDRLLTDVKFGKNPAVQNRFARAEQVWIVDEASLLSSAKLRDLFKAAEAEKARIVLVGDVRQLGSVEAGYGFGQLQQGGMATERLESIVRQTSDPLRRAVEHAAHGRAAAAMDHFVHTPGALTQEPDAEKRTAAVAAQWLALSPDERARTVIVDPSRAGRDAITDRIRETLIGDGALSDRRLDVHRYESKGLTVADKKQPMHYAVGDVVQFQRTLRFGQTVLEPGQTATVVARSQSDGAVTLKTAAGERLDWSPGRKGATSAEVFTPRATDLREGDRIVWNRNDKMQDLTNGMSGRIAAIDVAGRSATVAFDGGKTREITFDDHANRHWRHDYVQTAYAAQGRTSDRVIVHAESWRINLIHARSFYVAISRARDQGHLVTDDTRKLTEAVASRAGQKETALDRLQTEQAKRTATTTHTAITRAADGWRSLRDGVSAVFDANRDRGERRVLNRDRIGAITMDKTPAITEHRAERDIGGATDASRSAVSAGKSQRETNTTIRQDPQSPEDLQRASELRRAEQAANRAANQQRDTSRGLER